jgi:hypothetical protein
MFCRGALINDRKLSFRVFFSLGQQIIPDCNYAIMRKRLWRRNTKKLCGDYLGSPREAGCGGNAFNWVIYGKLDEGSLVSWNQFGVELDKFRLGYD